MSRYRILNSTFRGHVTQDAAHLSAALKIIMHTSYMYTRDHPQRTHEAFDIDLADVPPAVLRELPPDSLMGTGCRYEDFAVGQAVEMWLPEVKQWWPGKVTYKTARTCTLRIKLAFEYSQRAGVLPKLCRPA